MPELPAARFPNWYPDPSGRHGQRFFDGGRWTEHVVSGGRQGTDPLVVSVDEPALPPSAGPPAGARPARVVPLDDDPGAGDLRSARVLLVGIGAGRPDQPVHAQAVHTQPVHDQRGRRIGTVEVLRPLRARLARLLVTGEPVSGWRMRILGADDAVVVELVHRARPLQVRMPVLDGDGAEVGAVVQHREVTGAGATLEVGGAPLGAVDASRWADGHLDVVDGSGAELARVSRTWEVLAGSRFTPADTYVVQLAPGLADPVRAVVLAATLGVDTIARLLP